METNLRWKIALILIVVLIGSYYTYANIKWHGLSEEQAGLTELMMKSGEADEGRGELTKEEEEKMTKYSNDDTQKITRY